MVKKTVPFNKSGIENVPNNRPVVYKISSDGGRNNYTGIAQRGRVQDRLAEHLPNGKDPVPGKRVQIEQTSGIESARQKEANIIKNVQPKYNKQGK